MLLVVGLGGVHDLYTMQVHLTGGVELQGDSAALALVVEGNDLTIYFLLVHAGQGTDLLAVGIKDFDVVGTAVAAEGQRYGGLRTDEQVDLVVVVGLECPTVLSVVPVETARGVEGLVVGSVEELVSQVEGVLLVVADRLNLGGNGI